MEDLFIEQELDFEKSAAEATLPEDANTWPNEILQELFKQVPYIADFDPNVVMDRVDGEKGYGFGHVEVGNKTAMMPNADPQAQATAGVQKVRIPIIINMQKLQPFDILVTEDSKMLPLTESRLRQALFRPQTFDITSRTPGDHSMIGQLYPPFRQNNSMGGGSGITMPATMGKEGSAEKTALGKLLGEAVKKQTDPSRLANISRLAMSRGSQLAAQGGDAAAKGRKYMAVGTAAAQRMGKTASLLEAVLPFANGEEIEKVANQIAEDDALQSQFLKNGHSTAAALAVLASAPSDLTQKTAESLTSFLKADVAQLTKTSGGYLLKTANHFMWAPLTQNVDRGEAVRRFGSKVVLAADMNGAVTVEEGSAPPPEETPAGPVNHITDFGLYKVHDTEGNELVGYVFPNLIDLDGKKLPLALFTNGSQAAVQGEIFGEPVADPDVQMLPTGNPQGYGLFYRMGADGAEATLPFELRGSITEQGEVVMQGSSFDGNPVNVAVFQPGIEQVVMDGNTVLIPEDFQWLPLNKENEVGLASGPEEVAPKEAAQKSFWTVTVRGDNGCFSFDGLPVEKLASHEKNFLNLNDSLFLMAGLGANLGYVQSKLAEASAWSKPVDIRVGRLIKTAGTVRQEVLASARKKLASNALPKFNLVKEAAVIPDPVAVDTVLSLNFLNDENLTHFVSYLPAIDQAQERMCEMLVAARLGMREIPAGALERAIRSVEEVVEGLKVLAFQEN